MYFNIGTKALNPIFANVRAIRQKTPIGATLITTIVISIIMSLNWLKKLATVDVLEPSFANMIPTNKAKTIIGSISAVAKDSIGFFGIIFKRISVSGLLSERETSEVEMLSTLTPSPGLMREATLSATVTAIAVVNK